MILANKKIIYDIDNMAVKHNILPIQLMENAGGNAANIINAHIPHKSDILIVCGKGHNAGDGYVVARHLKMMNHNVSIFPLSIPVNKDDTTFINYSICKNLGIKFISKLSKKYSVIIDAILGVGARLPLSDNLSRIVKALNKIDAIKIALDIPTGINSDTGETDEITFLANFTVTMGIAKTGTYITPAKFACGKVYIAKLGIPESIYDNLNFNYNLIDKTLVKSLVPKRSNNSNKGTYGKVLAIGGSINYSGAITFSLQAAIKSGVGLVYTAIPKSIVNIVSNNVPDAIKIPLNTNKDGTIASNNEELLKTVNRYDALLIGPGIGTNPDTKKFIFHLLKTVSKPMILDADALRVLPEYGQKLRKSILITPHPGEAAMLLNTNASEINRKRLFYATRLSEKYGCTVMLKGYGTIVTDGKHFYINDTGDNTLARGGSGDILSGMILGFAGNGLDIISSAIVGTYLHGLAGEIAGKKSHGYSVSMKDILDSIPEAFAGGI